MPSKKENSKDESSLEKAKSEYLQKMKKIDNESEKLDKEDVYKRQDYSYLERGKTSDIRALIQDVKERKELKLQIGRTLYYEDVK